MSNFEILRTLKDLSIDWRNDCPIDVDCNSIGSVTDTCPICWFNTLNIDVKNMSFGEEKLKLIRIALSEHILRQKAGEYTEYNKLAKEIDKALDKDEAE